MTSIQNRLSLWLLGSVAVLLVTHWIVTSRAPVVFTEEYVATRLEHDAETLINGIRFDVSGSPILDEDHIAPIYLRPNSGHYYSIETAGVRFLSASLNGEDFVAYSPDLRQKSLFHHPGPGQQKLLVWAADFEKQGRNIAIVIAEELNSIDEHLNRFRARFGLLTMGLFVLLAISQRFIVKHSLEPLEQMKQACQQLETGNIDQLPENVPAEVKPLSNEINRLIEVMHQRLVRSRNALGNLAHALKTPLAVLAQIVEDRGNGLDSVNASQARSSVAMIQSIVNRELKRARLAGPVSAGQLFHLNSEVPDIIGLLDKIYAEKKLAYAVTLKQDNMIFGDQEDMLELLGNLLDNASKWAVHEVHLTAAIDEGLRITVEDDGPGIPAALRDTLITRGERYDESTQGHGLGLAIIHDIVNQYGGTIRLSDSDELGGLRVEINLPTEADSRN